MPLGAISLLCSPLASTFHVGKGGPMAAVIHTDGRQWPAAGLSRIRSKWWARRRENTIRKVEIRHDGRIYAFLCENLRDYALCGDFSEGARHLRVDRSDRKRRRRFL